MWRRRKFHLVLAYTILYFSVICETSSVLDFFKKASSSILHGGGGGVSGGGSGGASSSSDFSSGDSRKFYNHPPPPDYNQYTHDQLPSSSGSSASYTEFVPLPETGFNGTADSSHLNATETRRVGNTPDNLEKRGFNDPPTKVKEERGIVSHTYKQKYNQNYNYPLYNSQQGNADHGHKGSSAEGHGHPKYSAAQSKGHQQHYQGGGHGGYGHDKGHGHAGYGGSDGHGHKGSHIQPHYKDSGSSHHKGYEKGYGGHSGGGKVKPAGSHQVQGRGHGWGGGGHGWGGWGWGGGGGHHDSNMDLYSLLGGLSFASLLGATLLYLARNSATTVTVNATGRRRRRDLSEEDEPLLGLSLSEFLSSLGLSLSQPWWGREDSKPGGVVPFKLD